MAALHNVSENAQLVDEEFMGKLKEQIPNLSEVSRVEDCDFILNYCHFDPDAGLAPATVLHNQPNFPEKLKFLRGLSGNTLHSDEDFIKKLKEQVPNLKEVSTVEECDFILFFCPIVSRAGTDIEAALQKLQRLSDTKPVFVVVLHHTFDPDSVVPDSSRIVKRERTLSVDCLFHEDEGLLQCFRNDEALYNISEWINPQENSINPAHVFYGADPDTQEEKSTESTAALHNVSENAQLVDEEFMGKLKEQIPNLREVSRVEDCDFILNYCHFDPDAGLAPATVLHNQPNFPGTKPSLIVKVHHTPDIVSTATRSSSSLHGKKNLSINYPFYKGQGTIIRRKKMEEMHRVAEWIRFQVFNSF
ncbi:uncharacterized protein [Hoplias malabaricus]|uniref:uncharacterized protein n=1 Tax=Hoplias malabaricus TaxID=27720 RepID=UPI0034628C93